MPAETGKTYECNICGNVVKVIKGSFGTLVCCGEDMEMKEDE